MNHQNPTKTSLRKTIMPLVGGLVFGAMVTVPSYAITDTSPITRTQLGIEIPTGWNLGTTPYLGTISYSTRTAVDTTVSATSRRIEGAINLPDFVINEASTMATELTVNFLRDGTVYGQCTFDTATSLGGPTPNLADYQLRIVQRDTGEIQSQLGLCRTSTNGTDFAVGIPDVKDTDTVQLVSNNLSIQSTLPAQ